MAGGAQLQRPEAIALLARTEGILVDPCYTGKAMAGLVAHVRRGEVRADETIVFLHTGGAPGMFTREFAEAFVGSDR
jgi:1-aminocyclopropane-1-carboxylate deaminase/D-cysteine desulfhydrase-like pyridoxal-dependent ACC family enzyme